MVDVCLNEPDEKAGEPQHSLPTPERRKPYSESSAKKTKLRTLIWVVAALMIVVVILAFSIAYVNSTDDGESSSGSSGNSAPVGNTRDPALDDNAPEDGGMDFDYGESGGAGRFSMDSFSSSYNSADDGGSYNVQNDAFTGEPTMKDTFEPTYEPTMEITNGPTTDDTFEVSTFIYLHVSRHFALACKESLTVSIYRDPKVLNCNLFQYFCQIK